MSDKTMSISNWKREYKVSDEIKELLDSFSSEQKLPEKNIEKVPVV